MAQYSNLSILPASDLLADAARGYALAGWPVFPLRPGAKTPAISKAHGGSGFKDATTDADMVDRWWSQWPTANIGMPTGELFDVLDVDVKESGSGWGSLERLRRSGLLTGCVGIARTRNGGVHLFFPASGDRSSGLPFLDFKALGGYVVLPPSLVPGDLPESTGKYEWTTVPASDPGSPLDWSKVARALRPDRARSLAPAARLRTADGRVNGLARVVAASVEGERNSKLFWALRKAMLAGLDCQPILEAATAVGLADHEIENTYASARRHAAGAS